MTGKVAFEIAGKTYQLWFGMTATGIFESESIKQLNLQGGEGLDRNTSFATVVYAGLCNAADAAVKNRPTFAEALELNDEILLDEELQKSIYSAWEESKPVISMMERLSAYTKANGDKKKEDTKGKI